MRNGLIFEGQFVKRKLIDKNGVGVYIKSNGEIFIGDTKDGCFHTLGKLYCNDGTVNETIYE